MLAVKKKKIIHLPGGERRREGGGGGERGGEREEKRDGERGKPLSCRQPVERRETNPGSPRTESILSFFLISVMQTVATGGGTMS